MPWTTENRTTANIKTSDTPLLTEQLKSHLRDTYFPRYPTRRAVLLPALHLIQHTYNWIPMQAVQEIAEFLEIAPSEALDTATFYEEYWLRPKGKYLLQVCRSLSCEICGSRQLTDYLKAKLNLEEGETTPDGKYTLVELECLGACGTAPVALVNETLYENLDTQQLEQILASLPDDPHQFKDPTITWEQPQDAHAGGEHH
jgi:NADH-quinone oxidoreductase subunit E